MGGIVLCNQNARSRANLKDGGCYGSAIKGGCQSLCGVTPRPTPFPPTPPPTNRPTPKTTLQPTPFPTPFPTPLTPFPTPLGATQTTTVANPQCMTKTSCPRLMIVRVLDRVVLQLLILLFCLFSCLYLSGMCKWCTSTSTCVAASSLAPPCSSQLVLLSSGNVC